MDNRWVSSGDDKEKKGDQRGKRKGNKGEEYLKSQALRSVDGERTEGRPSWFVDLEMREAGCAVSYEGKTVD
ncbi:protein SCO1, mitochondrial-like protein [Corchorus olitorius]|uniref:Protein SCO1, mitochondrial-like protein n=1 Tax=Corchorus olitorius TaxID=93759 RepID=A0A1R3K266_9ROSI|nr:protein SCO1, mitochondrial-like protein [Corchorus olitorius]